MIFCKTYKRKIYRFFNTRFCKKIELKIVSLLCLNEICKPAYETKTTFPVALNSVQFLPIGTIITLAFSIFYSLHRYFF